MSWKYYTLNAAPCGALWNGGGRRRSAREKWGEGGGVQTLFKYINKYSPSAPAKKVVWGGG